MNYEKKVSVLKGTILLTMKELSTVKEEEWKKHLAENGRVVFLILRLSHLIDDLEQLNKLYMLKDKQKIKKKE